MLPGGLACWWLDGRHPIIVTAREPESEATDQQRDDRDLSGVHLKSPLITLHFAFRV
jgi:hypothetical protein